MKTRVLLAGVSALLMATSAAHARPKLSKTQSWKLTQGTWCVGDQPSDNEAYVGIARDKCGEDEKTLGRVLINPRCRLDPKNGHRRVTTSCPFVPIAAHNVKTAARTSKLTPA